MLIVWFILLDIQSVNTASDEGNLFRIQVVKLGTL